MVSLLDNLLAAQVETDTVVVGEGTADLGAEHQHGQEDEGDDQVGLVGGVADVGVTLLILPDIPGVQVDDEDDVVDDGMGDGCLNTGHHGVLGLAGGVLLPRTAVLLDHAHQLDVSRHDGWDGRDQARTQQEVAEAGDVEDRGR